MTLDERLFAEQMTYIDSLMYLSVLPKECLAWNKKDKEVYAPNIRWDDVDGDDVDGDDVDSDDVDGDDVGSDDVDNDVVDSNDVDWS